MGSGKNDHIALFVDIENFVGFCSSLGLRIDLGPVIEQLTKMGKVTVRKSFGDIHMMPLKTKEQHEIRKMLQHNLMIHEDVIYQTTRKNAADMRLVIDALSMAFTNDDIGQFAVVGVDRDYLPLFAKLREMGKEIIAVSGSKDRTPETYVRACDYFYYYENLCSPAAPASDPLVPEAPAASAPVSSLLDSGEADENPTGYDVPSAVPSAKADAISLLVEALQAFEAKGGDEAPGVASVMTMMRRLNPDLDLREYGYKSFNELCEKAAEAGAIQIVREGTTMMLTLLQPRPKVELPPMPKEEMDADLALKRWLEEKMKVPLPRREEREKIYQQLITELCGKKAMALAELSKLISGHIQCENCDQTVYYKVLYGLYRGGCFSCTPGGTQYNPIVNSFRVIPKNPSDLDQYLIENSIRIYLREQKGSLDTATWSKVFFDSESRANYIAEIAQAL